MTNRKPKQQKKRSELILEQMNEYFVQERRKLDQQIDQAIAHGKMLKKLIARLFDDPAYTTFPQFKMPSQSKKAKK